MTGTSVDPEAEWHLPLRRGQLLTPSSICTSPPGDDAEDGLGFEEPLLEGRGFPGMSLFPDEGLAHLLASADENEGHPRVQHLVQSEACGHENGLRCRLIDDDSREEDLQDNAYVELRIGKLVQDQGLCVRCGGQGSCNLPNHQRVVVQRGRHPVGVHLLWRELLLAYVSENAICSEVHHPAARHLHHAHIEVGIDENARVHNLFQKWVAWFAFHQLRLLRLPSVRDCRPDVCADVNGQDLGDVHCQWDACQLHEVGNALRHLRT
mmetsp:Transcript_25071/g.56867  ORF Transcript_25071/g.56867 Transcript_25071/m.56867 type:complete len:265 (-) Transcript_25071:2535-3329(-)